MFSNAPPIRLSAGVLSLSILLAACGSGEQEPTGNWHLVWSDEFDEPALDASKWSHEVDCFGGGNNEEQCYTSRPENTEIVDGVLSIVAREETFSGPALMEDMEGYNREDTSVTKNYTSARLRTKGIFSLQYGRFEIRARLPAGQGVWPAFWMLPEDSQYGGWPTGGEIDILEGFNVGVDGAERVSGATQYGMKHPNYVPKFQDYDVEKDWSGEFHVYALEWEADELRWFIDGDHYMTQRADNWYSAVWGGQDKGLHVPTPGAPFDQPFHMIMNLAIGGDAPGKADTDWESDRRFEIDYVRVYRCDALNPSGRGCKNTMDQADPELEAMPDDGAPFINRFALYDNGPVTLELERDNTPVNNTLVVTAERGGSVTESGGGLGRGKVIKASFERAGSVSLASGDMRDTSVSDDGVELRGRFNWSQEGQLEFDLKVDSIDEGVELWAGFGGAEARPIAIDIPPVGQWQRVYVSLFEMLSADGRVASDADLTHINPLLTVQATGPATIEIDNVAISCAITNVELAWLPPQHCSLQPAVTVTKVKSPAILFDDEPGDWKPVTINPGVTYRVEGGGEYERVMSVRFFGDGTFVGFGDMELPSDFSAFEGGTIEFDLLIENEPEGTEWSMVVDCGYPCATGPVPLSESVEGKAPVVGEWQHYTFRVDDLVNREGSSLDLTKVFLPLAIFPTWTNQNGAAYKIDNIVWTGP